MKLKMSAAVILSAFVLCFVFSACGKEKNVSPDPTSSAETAVTSSVGETAETTTGRFDFDYQFSDSKMTGIEELTGGVKEIHAPIPALKSVEDINTEYVSEFFKNYYSGIDPQACEIYKDDNGDKVAVVSENTVRSLMFLIFRAEGITIPSKSENPAFYLENGTVYISLKGAGEGVYTASKPASDGINDYMQFTSKTGENFRLIFAQDEDGIYVSAVTY